MDDTTLGRRLHVTRLKRILVCLFFFAGSLIALLFTQFLIKNGSPFRLDQPYEVGGAGYVAGRMLLVAFFVLGARAAGLIVLALVFPSRRCPYSKGDSIFEFAVGAAMFRILAFFFPLAESESSYFIPLLFAICISTAEYFSLGRPSHSIFAVRHTVFRARLLYYAGTFFASIFACIVFSKLWLLPVDGDFLSHYGQYLMSIARSGSLVPNDVWYHYFYSKGNSIEGAFSGSFDIAAKLDVSLAYVILAIVVVERFCRYLELGRTATLACLSMLPVYFISSDIGFLGKNHAIVCAILVIQVFLHIDSNNRKYEKESIYYYFVSALNGMNLVLVSPPALIFFLPILGIFFLSKDIRKPSTLTRAFFCTSAIMITFVYILYLNYINLGLYEINPSNLFFKYMDFNVFSEHYTPYLITYLQVGSGADFGGISITLAGVLDRLAQGTHIDLFQTIYGSSFILVVAIVGVLVLLRRYGWKVLPIFVPIIFSALAMALVSQPVSVYRATTFAGVFLVLAVGAGIAECVRYLGSTDTRRKVLLGLLVILFAITGYRSGILQGAGQIVSYAAGRLTADAYYGEASSKMGYSDTTTIAVDLKKKYGADTRIMTLSLVSNRLGRAYLVGTGLKSEVSYAFGSDWAKISFGPTDQALSLLKKHAEIILLDTSRIGISTIAFAKIFDPKVMPGLFNVVARDGVWIALAPKDSRFDANSLRWSDIRAWTRAREDASYRDLAQSMAEIYRFNGGDVTHRPILPPDFKRPIGWQ